MQSVTTDNDRKTDQLTPSIYAALVDSLFQNAGPVLAGNFAAIAGSVMTAMKTGQWFLWPCAIWIIVVGCYRAYQMYEYGNDRRDASLTPDRAKVWEPRYKIGADLYASALGIWCFAVLVGTDDIVAHMLCASVTIGYIAASVGRNYGRPKIIQSHILLACTPLSIGLALRGDPYYIGLAVLLALFFVGLRFINLNLNRIFVKALTATEHAASIARLFDTALNNMPHGLCMYSADGKLSVVNRAFVQMMNLEKTRDFVDHSAGDVLAACVSAGSLSKKGANAVNDLIDGARAAEITTVDHNPVGERGLSWTLQPMASGGVVLLVEDITERRNAEARISHMARFDELTGLPNRVNFRNEITRILASADETSRQALLFVDLDQFKQVNDTLGHPCGDQLLCLVADRLRAMLRPQDLVARFGGDEFVVFVKELVSANDAARLAKRIVEELSERYEIERHQVEIGASVGIAVTSPGISADVLLKNADLALYRAKADGRGTFCFFRPEMAKAVEARRVLELDIRQALANDEFELYYQPLVNIKSGRISTCEALLRWNHPVRGMVSPGDIIPVVEDMGLIVELGRWILRKACIECVKWPDAVSVAVNFSTQQFHHRDVLNEIRYALDVSGLEARRLEVEITESSLLRNTQLTHDVLAKLCAAGVRISLDDFGTGYSSLSYLHNFPLHKVKIDRSFLEGIGTERPLTLLRGVARLSVDLGMSVVVEGIETNEQLEVVAAEGTVTEAQGFLFSKPVPAAQIRELLAASHARPAEPVAQPSRARTVA